MKYSNTTGYLPKLSGTELNKFDPVTPPFIPYTIDLLQRVKTLMETYDKDHYNCLTYGGLCRSMSAMMMNISWIKGVITSWEGIGEYIVFNRVMDWIIEEAEKERLEIDTPTFFDPYRPYWWRDTDLTSRIKFLNRRIKQLNKLQR